MNTLQQIFTSRQMQIVDLLCEGCSNKQIASVLGTTEQRVKNQLYRMFDIAGAWSRHELAMRRLREQRTIPNSGEQCISQHKPATAGA